MEANKQEKFSFGRRQYMTEKNCKSFSSAYAFAKPFLENKEITVLECSIDCGQFTDGWDVYLLYETDI